MGSLAVFPLILIISQDTQTAWFEFSEGIFSSSDSILISSLAYGGPVEDRSL